MSAEEPLLLGGEGGQVPGAVKNDAYIAED